MLEELLPKDKEELKVSFLSVVSQLINRGEMMKGLMVLLNAPAIIEDDEEVLLNIKLIKEQLERLASFQRHGTWNGYYNGGFVLPESVEKITKYNFLLKKLENLSLKKIVDVGCFSGWLGRALSLKGIVVHGIDIHPVIIQLAALVNSGSLCSFEFLTGEKLGIAHTREFDAAVLFDVLEHSTDPKILLRSVERSVKKSGWVFINVPSVEGEQMADIHDLERHEHIYSFTKNRLLKLLEGKSPEIETIYQDGVPSWFISYSI